MEHDLAQKKLLDAASKYRIALERAKKAASTEDGLWVKLASDATKNPHGNFIWGQEQHAAWEKSVPDRQATQIELSAAIAELLDAAEKT